jgi:hypothetical protein
MYSRQLCLLRVVQAAVVDALFLLCMLYAMCMFYVWTDLFKYIISHILFIFFFFCGGKFFCDLLIYFCIETFEDLPALYHLYYYEPPIPYATPTPGIVVQDLRTIVGLPIHNLPLSIVNTFFPMDEIVLASTVLDWMRANANFATLVTFSQSKFNSMIFMPPTHMALTARRQALRRVFLILCNQALSEYNPN